MAVRNGTAKHRETANPPAAAAPGLREAALSAEAADSPDLLRALRLFFRTGRRSDPLPVVPSELAPLPVALHGYRDLSRHRIDYPVVLADFGDGPPIQPLREVIDAIAEGTALDGEEREAYRHALLRVEAAIRAIADPGRDEALEALWDRAVKSITTRTAGRRNGSSQLQELIAPARLQLPRQGNVLACAQATPARLLSGLASREARAATASLLTEIERLRSRLEDILAVDDGFSAAANDPAHLRAAVGGSDELDAASLSQLIDGSAITNRLPVERRGRLSRLVSVLAEAPVTLDPAEDAAERSLDDVRGCIETRRADLVRLVRAIRMSKLEAENQYRQERHDALFAQFGWSDLEDAEAALCPAVRIDLDAGRMVARDYAELLALLGTDLPVKVLLTVDRMVSDDDPEAGDGLFAGWRSRLGAMALSLRNAFVLQTVVSDLDRLVDGLREGLHYPGPALYVVYTGEASGPLHPFLRAAIALDSRVFPAFRYDPSRGIGWADRLYLGGNQEPERVWLDTEIEYETASGDASARSLAFTAGDFLACDPAFAGHFAELDPRHHHSALMPLDAFLDLQADQAELRIPYILTAGEDGVMCRTVVTRSVARAARDAAVHWRSLRELGGIESSHVQRALEAQRKAFEQEKQDALEEAERRYGDVLDRATGELAEEIVANIAANLLNVPAGPVRPISPAPAARPTPSGDAPQPVETVTEDAPRPVEEQESLSFDEPYIETPRCTTCNECTVLNSAMFAYNEEKQAYIKDASAGTFREIVIAAEKCPVRIIHPGKPRNPNEPNLPDLIKRAEPFA